MLVDTWSVRLCTTVLSNGRDLLAVCCISRFKVEKLECRGECLGNKGFRKKWWLLFCFADRRLGPISVVWKKLAVRRMVPADSMHPLGIRQEVFGEHAAKTFLCQEELISQTRQLFKVVMESFPLEIFKNRAENISRKCWDAFSPDWGNYLVLSFRTRACFLPSQRRVCRKAVGIHKECTCLKVLSQPKSQNLAWVILI